MFKYTIDLKTFFALFFVFIFVIQICAISYEQYLLKGKFIPSWPNTEITSGNMLM